MTILQTVKLSALRSLSSAGVASVMLTAMVSLAPELAPAQAQQQADGPPPAVVEVREARNEMMAPQVFMPGTIVSKNDSRISAQVSGSVNWVAPEGTYLEKGDVVARIDDSNFRLAVERNRAQMKRLEARLSFLQSELKRALELAETDYSPISRVEEARSNVAMAEQELSTARIALKQSEIDLARTAVKAPFPGHVVERLAQAGEYSVPGRQLVRLVDTRNLEVAAKAPVALSAALRDGQTVMLRQNDELVPARIRALVPVGDERSRNMDIRVIVPEGQMYVVGEALQVGLPESAPERVVAVPRDALVLRTDGTYVFRVSDENTAERLRVETGTATGTLVAVRGGINGGDKVIVRGGERLRPGQAVQLREEAPASELTAIATAAGQ